VPAIPIPVVTVAAIASVFIAVLIALTVTRATDFNPEAGYFDATKAGITAGQEQRPSDVPAWAT